MKSFDVNEKFNVHVYLASIYIFILNYICMHMLRYYESLKKKKCKDAYVYLHIYIYEFS